MNKHIREIPDRRELVSLMEPMKISETSGHREVFTDLSVELAAHSTGFRRSLPEGVLAALADLVRVMNCYYSNLIEGHDTHPVDIERAMNDDYSANADQRNLQLEARAHIAVQQWIDEGGLYGRAVSLDGICEVHKRFGELLPERATRGRGSGDRRADAGDSWRSSRARRQGWTTHAGESGCDLALYREV